MDTGQSRHKIRLTGAQATLLVTLYAKAADSRSAHSLLHDTKAQQIVDSLEYDTDELKALRSDNLIVVRACQYDQWVRDFLSAHSDAVVVYLGAGLDSRITRIAPPASVSWFDIDYPDVIELRRNFYDDSGAYSMIASSITDPAWLERIPRDRPTLIIAEGCLEYLTPQEVKELLNRLTAYFAHGQIAFDVMSSSAIEFARKQLAQTMGAAHRWAVDDIRDVDALDAKLKRVACVPVFASSFAKGLPLHARMLYRLASLIPQARDTMRILLYEF